MEKPLKDFSFSFYPVRLNGITVTKCYRNFIETSLFRWIIVQFDNNHDITILSHKKSPNLTMLNHAAWIAPGSNQHKLLWHFGAHLYSQSSISISDIENATNKFPFSASHWHLWHGGLPIVASQWIKTDLLPGDTEAGRAGTARYVLTVTSAAELCSGIDAEQRSQPEATIFKLQQLRLPMASSIYLVLVYDSIVIFWSA